MTLFPALAAALTVCGLVAQTNSAAPQMRDLNGRRALFVDDKPYLVLGMQWDCDTPFSREMSDPLYAQAAKMGCNTAVVPLFWREVEPSEGQYDFGLLDGRLDMARRSGLRLVLVWFGSYKNGCLNYAPDFVKSDPHRFRRARKSDGTELRNFSCPTSTATWNQDRKALEAVFRHLKSVDAESHTVILFQMENEAGLLGTDRCHCPTCNAEFEKGGWSAREGARAAEAFTAHSIATYADTLAAAVKPIYPLPVYVNAWLGSKTGVAGKDYPSGGPVERVLDVYAKTVKQIDFIAPDIYSHQLDGFRSISQGYSGKGWPLYIAEHSSGKDGRAERNVFYALGEFAALGFSPWAIDRSFPDMDGAPLVHQLDQRWSEEAYDMRDSYVPLRDAMIPIAMAQGSDRLKFFVQEGDEGEKRLTFGDIALLATYRHKKHMARGMGIRLGKSEFLVLGTGFNARFINAKGEGVPLAKVERGRFDGEKWRIMLPIRRESEDRSAGFRVVEPQVIRVEVDTAGK